MLPKPTGWAGDLPNVRNGKPLRAIVIAERMVQFQHALRHRHGRQIVAGSLHERVPWPADTLAVAVQVLRPRIRSIQLEAAREASLEAPLHGVIRRIPLAGVNRSWPEVRVKILTV